MSGQEGKTGGEEEGETSSGELIINIRGEKVALGPRRRDLLPTQLKWMNNFDTLRLAGFVPRPRTREQQIARYDEPEPDDDVMFVIYEVTTWRAIGISGLRGIDRHNRTAEFGIVIGEPDCRGKGYGTETASLVLDYAFTVLGLHSVFLTTSEYNIAGQRAYRKAGFRDAGRLRQAEMMGGRMWDVLYMDCLASEFTSPVLRDIFLPGETRGE